MSKNSEANTEKLKIGARLERCRIAMKPKISQAQAARNLGIGRSHLTQIENDKGHPSLDVLVKMADYYNTTADFILGRKVKQLSDQAREINNCIMDTLQIYVRLAQSDLANAQAAASPADHWGL